MKFVILTLLILQISYSQQSTTYACPTGSYWNDQTCIPCLNDSCVCSTYNGCSSQIACTTGYAQSPTSSSTGYFSCTACPDGCSACTLSGSTGFSCSTCSSGFQLIQNACISISSAYDSYIPSQGRWTILNSLSLPIIYVTVPCLALNSGTGLCETCPLGSFMDEYGLCEQCVSGCSLCQSRGTCVTCSTGSYWSADASSTAQNSGAGTGNCVSCGSAVGIATCSSSGIPLTCSTGFFLELGSPSICTACSIYCSVCAGASTCTSCQTGTFLKNGICTLCAGNTPNVYGYMSVECQTCTVGGSTSCDTCATGFQLVGSLCSSCTSTIIGCTTCQIVNNNLLSCSACEDGYYLQAGTTSTSQAICQLCSDVNPNYQYCNKGSTGTATTVTPTQCTTYSFSPLSSYNYFLVSGNCTSNIGACLYMENSTGYCKTCVSGYQNIDGVCTYCPSNCATCIVVSSATTCSVCNSGYYQQDGLCNYCASGCSVCTAADVCTTCFSSGYNLSGGVCTPCNTANCLTCPSSVATCTACQTQYFSYVSGGVTQCLLCPPGCSDCQSGSGRTCTTCLSGYYKKGMGCSQGTIQCAVFLSDGTGACSVCNYGFRATNGICLPCVQVVNGYVCNSNAGSTNCFNNHLTSLIQILSLVIAMIIIQ